MKSEHESSLVEPEGTLTGTEDEVLADWVRLLSLKEEDFINQFLNKSQLFTNEVVQGVDPSTDVRFWLKYGVNNTVRLQGVVHRKTDGFENKDIVVSSYSAERSARKLENGVKITHLSGEEILSLMLVTKAKLLASQIIAVDVYPGLKSIFKEELDEVNAILVQILENGQVADKRKSRINKINLANSIGKMPLFVALITLTAATHIYQSKVRAENQYCGPFQFSDVAVNGLPDGAVGHIDNYSFESDHPYEVDGYTRRSVTETVTVPAYSTAGQVPVLKPDGTLVFEYQEYFVPEKTYPVVSDVYVPEGCE